MPEDGAGAEKSRTLNRKLVGWTSEKVLLEEHSPGTARTSEGSGSLEGEAEDEKPGVCGDRREMVPSLLSVVLLDMAEGDGKRVTKEH